MIKNNQAPKGEGPVQFCAIHPPITLIGRIAVSCPTMDNNNGSFFSEKKWKYISIVLMAILATGGALAPVAFAQNRPGPQAIWDAIDNLQAQINALVATDESLESRIDALETENANQQQQIDALDARIDALEQEDGSGSNGGGGDNGGGGGDNPPIECDDGDPNTIDYVVDGVCFFEPVAQEGDQDGAGFTIDEGDCDDSDPNINPEATEIDGDFIDNNCNGIVDQA